MVWEKLHDGTNFHSLYMPFGDSSGSLFCKCVHITHRPAGNCCTKPPNTYLRNSILLRYGWMIGQKNTYKIDSVGHPIVFFCSTRNSLSNLHILAGFYTKGRPLVKSNLICPSDKLSWQPGCPVLNINIQGNFSIKQANSSSDNLPENLV